MKVKRVTVSLLVCVLVCGCESSQASESLSRGQQLLIEKWGLQIGGDSPRFASGGRINMKRWAKSNFTTVYLTPVADCYRLGSPPGVMFGGSSNPNPAMPEAILTDSPDNPNSARKYLQNFVMYKYKDEQGLTAKNIEEARMVFEGGRRLYPDTLFYISQPGRDDSPSEIRNYMRKARPDILSWCYYPFDGTTYSDYGGAKKLAITKYYSYMAKYRLMGMEGIDGTGSKPIPVGHWVQAYLNKGHLASESEIRLNQFSGWVFGQKITIAWRYNSTSDDYHTILFSDDKDARPTKVFGYFAETNRQSRNLGPALVCLTSSDVRCIPGWHRNQADTTVKNPWPRNVRRWNSVADPYIKRISATNIGSKNNGLRGDVLVGYFKPLLESMDGEKFKDQIYFMIVNGLYDLDATAAETQQNIHIEFNFGRSGITELQRLSRDTGQVESVPLAHDSGSRYYLDLVLEGGTGDLFKFNTGAPFVTNKISQAR